MKRKKASDYFNASEPFLGKKVGFVEAFPSISEISVTVIEFKDFWKKNDGFYPNTRYYDQYDLPGQFIDCTNPACDCGGFSIGNIISEMVSTRKESLEDSTKCRGKEGRNSSRSCMHLFEYQIKIRYK